MPRGYDPSQTILPPSNIGGGLDSFLQAIQLGLSQPPMADPLGSTMMGMLTPPASGSESEVNPAGAATNADQLYSPGSYSSYGGYYPDALVNWLSGRTVQPRQDAFSPHSPLLEWLYNRTLGFPTGQTVQPPATPPITKGYPEYQYLPYGGGTWGDTRT